MSTLAARLRRRFRPATRVRGSLQTTAANLRPSGGPAAGPDRDLHNRLLELRRKAYAHTDPAGGRNGLAQLGPGNVLGIGEEWMPLGGGALPAIADLFDRQAARFQQALVSEIDAASKRL